MAKKGYPNTPGIPELWDEVKKKVGIVLTPTAIAKLDELARHYGLSKSELIERIARGWIPLGKMQEPSSEPSIRFNRNPFGSCCIRLRQSL